ncbi:MAG: hypothetical protein IPH11_04480 [Ignavibacteriales bacterium]|nr:hypothetical protein [Ignavibacteriales bacterium]
MTQRVLYILFISLTLIFWSCGKSGEEKVADKEGNSNEQVDENSPEAYAEKMKQMGENLTEGKKVEPVDFRELKALYPESINGMKRTNSSGEKTAAFNMNISHAEADYSSEDGSKSFDINITDMGNMSGLTQMAAYGWAMGEFDRETDSGYEKTTNFSGYKAYEEYNNEGKYGKLQVLVSSRFIVEASGNNITMEELKSALGQIGLSKLESWKNFGIQ